MFNKQTTLDLDGPKLGFTTDPQNITVNAGTAATFVAIGTATFPSNIPAKFATNTGIVTYRWYVDDVAVSSTKIRNAAHHHFKYTTTFGFIGSTVVESSNLSIKAGDYRTRTNITLDTSVKIN